MPIHRIMIVDDEVLVRQGLAARINQTGDIQVVTVSSTSQTAITKLESNPVDALVIDWNFDDENPSNELNAIRHKFPELLIVSVVPTDYFARKIQTDSLQSGRSELIVRPRQSTTTEAFLDELSKLVIKRLHFMFNVFDRTKSGAGSLPATDSSKPAYPSVAPEFKSNFSKTLSTSQPIQAESLSNRTNLAQEPPRPESKSRLYARQLKRIEVIAIASSTGGPNALAELLPALPADLPVPVVIVQHMPPEFTKSLADRLNNLSPMRIKEATNGDRLQPGQALIAPGDWHMLVERSLDKIPQIVLNQAPPENSCRPAADVLFRSVAKVYGENVLAVVLTGMGKDGLAGARLIHETGGQVIAQDEASSIVWGMPGEVVHAKLADAILPLNEIARDIIRRAKVGRST